MHAFLSAPPWRQGNPRRAEGGLPLMRGAAAR